ncbi:uncharacterized protein PGTG_14306 [Puccinia graminis f. sp. tritici CRL 75-36-700-3]|uniref:DUF6818 domain-containing protein n=1 Tax=Puccinia graminis f. sp. tritici (strain CRL 75-36-700-3 / race SCCL) TaxID=418459 RepID=E3KVC7_PUCGT|nr:uncharacterized protein PGTG_14306 [Puccinia graminis f. sp. tritici CRL 75-36-700-3]EFP88222.1 hypothetical protein PGTG_14306 [Puccinia graminis f. sp. tritici CRL 75-36-700-3]
MPQIASTTQLTQQATQRSEATATNITHPTSTRQTGRQQGSQGYSGNNCLALVNFVKHVRPLGSNDWEHVHELYNQYAAEAGRPPHDANPLKTKFRALVASKKPTGDPDCQVWWQERILTKALAGRMRKVPKSLLRGIQALADAGFHGRLRNGGFSVYCGGATRSGGTEGRKRGSERARGGSGGERPVQERPEEYLD